MISEPHCTKSTDRCLGSSCESDIMWSISLRCISQGSALNTMCQSNTFVRKFKCACEISTCQYLMIFIRTLMEFHEVYYSYVRLEQWYLKSFHSLPLIRMHLKNGPILNNLGSPSFMRTIKLFGPIQIVMLVIQSNGALVSRFNDRIIKVWIWERLI